MIVGITGNIGSGKSTAGKIFADHGFSVIDADKVGHDVLQKKEVKEKVVKYFGDKILTRGNIDRKKLKDIVFYHPERLKELNAITHPIILEDIKNQIKKTKGNIAVEAALIVEAGWDIFDHLYLVTIEKKIQLERLLAKGKYNKDEINNILASQMLQEDKMMIIDRAIDNSGTKEEFEERIKKAIADLPLYDDKYK